MARQSKSQGRSIQATFLRLGLHVSASQGIEELGRRAIDVSEEQVECVGIDLLRGPAAIRRPPPPVLPPYPCRGPSPY